MFQVTCIAPLKVSFFLSKIPWRNTCAVQYVRTSQSVIFPLHVLFPERSRKRLQTKCLATFWHWSRQ